MSEESAKGLEAVVSNSTVTEQPLVRNGWQDALEYAVKSTLRHEEWKYLNLLPLLKLGLAFESSLTKTEGSSFHPAGSQQSELGPSIVIENGNVLQLTHDAQVVANAAHHHVVRGTATESPFVAFATDVAPTVVEVVIPPGTVRSEPLRIIVSGNSSQHGIVFATRVRVIASEGSSVVIEETHTAQGQAHVLGLMVTELQAHPNSHIEYVKTTNLPDNARHIGATLIQVKAHARVDTHTFCLGGPLVRNDLYVRLEESGAETYLNGLSHLHGNEVADNHTAVDHLVPHCHSEELYKGIYHDASMGVFNGKIFVRHNAQKTTAYQSSRSLLLGDRAQVNAKPQLEIWADDVKCSHGATTGQLDEETIFYLRSRGIRHEKAKALLVEAFEQEMYERLPAALRAEPSA